MRYQVAYSPCSIAPLAVGEAKLEFQKDLYGHPAILVSKDGREHTCSSLSSLIEAVPEINTEGEILSLAMIVNFFTHGEDFKFISDAEGYKNEYKEEIEREENSFDAPLLAYGKYNVEEVSPPKILNEKHAKSLVFYVKKKIPFRVSLEFPIAREHPRVDYQTLPLI